MAIDLDVPVTDVSAPAPDSPLADNTVQAAPKPTSAELDKQAADFILHNQGSQIRNNVLSSLGQSPDQAAQYQALAKQTGTPVESVYANPDAVKAQAAMLNMDADKLATQYPHLAQYLTNKYNAAKSSDDIQNLAGVEQTAKALPAASAANGVPDLDGSNQQTGSPFLNWLSSLNNPDAGEDNTGPDASQQAVGSVVGGLESSVIRAARGVNLAMSVFPSAYDSAAALMSGQNDHAALTAYNKYFIEPLDQRAKENAFDARPDLLSKTLHASGDVLGTIAMIAATGGMGAGVEIPAAASALEGAGAVVAGAARTMAFPAITGALNTGHDVYEQTGSLAQAVAAATSSYGQTVGMGLLPMSLPGGVVKRVLTGLPVGGVTGEMMRNISNLTMPASMQTPANLDDILVNSITGAVLAGAMGGGHAPVQDAIKEAYDNGLKAMQSGELMAHLQGLDQMAAKAKTRERDADAFHEFITTMTEDGHAPDVYIDAHKLNEVLAQSGIKPEDLAQKLPGVSDQMNAGLNTNGLVRIPLADYATSIAGTPLSEQLLPHLKTDPEGMTYTEGQAYAQTQKDTLTQQAGKLVQDQATYDERQQQLQTIGQTITDQLKATGRFTDSQAKEYAAMHMAIFDTLSSRLNMTPERMYQDFPLNVENATPEIIKAASGEDVLNQEGANNDGQPGQAGNRSGQPERDGSTPLENIPTVEGATGPDRGVNAVADQYARDHGINLKRQSAYATVDPERAARIAHEYDAMAHAPDDPKVKEAYADLIRQTTDQYHALANAGYKFWFIDDKSEYKGKPYTSSPFNALRDLRENKSMGVFPTEEGFGSNEDVSALVRNNPLLADTGIKWPMGSPDGPLHPVTANDLFRAVHDAFGHSLEGAGFRADGEENAWQAHARLFHGPALGALTSETRGQNSWLNFGPHGETNRNAKTEDTIFADQKTGLMPEWTWREGFDPGASDMLHQGLRGVFTTGDSTIHLTPNADLSTFLHESGHFYLDMMHQLSRRSDLPPQMRNDFDTLLQSFKVEGSTPEERLANWEALGGEGRREGHEQFAEGFERYLMTGRAPTVELQSMFGRFRSWLMQVYQNLSNIGAPISPEVKGVMDRLFATDEAISQAEKTSAFVEAADLSAHASPEELARYFNLHDEAHRDALAAMQARSLRDIKWLDNAKSRVLKALQKEANGERAKIRDEVTKEVEKEPVNQARKWLKTGETTDAKGNDIKATEGFKLNKADLESMFPKGELGSVDLSGLRGMTGKDGLHPDLVADMFGFNSGKELVGALLNAPKAKDKIAGMTDQRMLEEHGDLVDPVSIQEAARAAIHNEGRAKMMATGLKILAKSPVSSTEINKQAKAAADTAIAAVKVGEIRPAKYSAAEAKANKELIKLAPTDTMGALGQQRAALLNNRLYKSAQEGIEDVRKGLVYFKRFDRDTTRSKIALAERDLIDDLLSRFDLRANPTDKPTRAQQNLEQYIESQRAAGMEPSITADMFRPEYRVPYREMTLESFRGLVDSIKSLEKMGRSHEEVMVDGEKRDLKTFINDEINPKLQARGARFSTEELHTRIDDRGNSKFREALDTISSLLRSTDVQLEGQQFKANNYDRHDILGPITRAIFEPMFQGNYLKNDRLKAISNDFRAKMQELGAKWQKSLTDMVPNTTLIDKLATEHNGGQPVYMKISRGKMVVMGLNVGNESNFDKMVKGYGWEPAKVWQFLHENMTHEDWKAAQATGEAQSKHWEEQVAMQRRLGQTVPDKIEPRPFMTKFGEMPGWYSKVSYDPLRSKKGERDAAAVAVNPGAELFGPDAFNRRTTTNGSMNARKDGYTDAIDLNFHTVERNIHDAIHDLSYREPLINANKIIEHPDFRREFMKAYGREAYQGLQEWLGRIANSENYDRQAGALGRIMQYTRSGLVMNAIALRVSTVLKHGGSAGIKTMGYFVGGGEKYLAARFAAMGTNYKQEIAGAIAKFPEIRSRLMQQDRDYRATASSLFTKESLQSRAERFGHSAVAWADMFTAVPTAWAAYDRAITEGIPVRQGGTGKPMTEAQAVAYASKIVREAHGSQIETARSNIMTNPHEGVKMMTMIYGFMNNNYGQMSDAISKYRTPGMGKPEILARAFMSLIVPALWAELLNDGIPKADKWSHFVGKAITGEVAGSVPLVRDAYSMMQDFRGAGVVGVESWMTSIANGGKAVYKVTQGEVSKGKPISAIADMVGMGLHIPGLGQLGKSAQNIVDMESGNAYKPDNLPDYLYSTVMKPKKPHF